MAELSDVSGAPRGTEPKVGIGKTGVHLRYHKTSEYGSLPPDQKRELALWRVKNPLAVEEQKKKKAKKTRVRATKSDRMAIASAVKTAFEDEKRKNSEDTTSREEEKRFIMSLFESLIPPLPQSLQAQQKTRNLLQKFHFPPS